MKFILLLLILSLGTFSFAQKRKKNKQPYSYSYTVTPERYQFKQTIEIQISEITNDTLVISGSSADTSLMGSVYMYRSGKKVQTTLSKGQFSLKIDAISWKTGFLLEFDGFENYDDQVVSIQSGKNPHQFPLELEGKTIFDPETYSIYIHSKTELSQKRIDEIIRCMGLNRDHSNCYDSNEIMIILSI